VLALIDRERALALETRRKLFEEIRRFPGIHFRELRRRTGLAIGSLQYHLDVLCKTRLVRAEKRGKFIRYFPLIGEPSKEEREALSLLREENVRKIVLYIADKKRATNRQLARFLGLSPSTVSFHISKLVSAGLVSKQRRRKKSYFVLTNPELVKDVIITYRKSFLDKLVDSFVETWEEF